MIMLSYWTVEYSTPYSRGERSGNGHPNYVTRVVLDDDPDSESYSTMADVPKIIENSTGRYGVQVVNVRQQIRH